MIAVSSVGFVILWLGCIFTVLAQDPIQPKLSIPHISFEVKRVVKHDQDCFTQGLQLYKGFLYESCGLNGKSNVRKVNPTTGAVLKQTKLSHDIFAEGITILNDKIYLITWKNKKMLLFDINTLELLVTTSFQTFNGEGWGLTHNSKNELIASDGSDRLTFLSTPKGNNDPSIKLKDVIVKDPKTGSTFVQINELEYVNGYVYANIWYQDIIIKIDPDTGHVVEKIDMKTLYTNRVAGADCLNGIAFNESSNVLILTGKLWPKYFHVSLDEHLTTLPVKTIPHPPSL